MAVEERVCRMQGSRVKWAGSKLHNAFVSGSRCQKFRGISWISEAHRRPQYSQKMTRGRVGTLSDTALHMMGGLEQRSFHAHAVVGDLCLEGLTLFRLKIGSTCRPANDEFTGIFVLGQEPDTSC